MQAELVERASRGNQDAFASQAAASVDGCYALAYGTLRDSLRAQDATQRALLGAWRDLSNLRDVTKSTPGSTASGQCLLRGGSR